MIPFIVRRSRWMLFGWAAKKVGRAGFDKTVHKSIDKAAANLDDKMPELLSKSLDRLPGDMTRAGGAVVVASQSVKSAGSVARNAAGTARRMVAAPRSGSKAVSSRVHDIRDELTIESDEAYRRIKSEMLRETQGDAAALEALLDLRPRSQEPIPSVGPAVSAGRRRHRPELPGAPINRVRRTYQQATRPWDRPPRRS